jgi:hypothetical protein
LCKASYLCRRFRQEQGQVQVAFAPATAPPTLSSPGTVAFHTLGCKLNFSETSTLTRSLEEAGYAKVMQEERPDVFVLNTCSVTENADKECCRHVRRFQTSIRIRSSP